MGIAASMAKKISFGCGSRTYSFEELKDCYDDNMRTVIPVTQAPEDVIVAVNECGEEVIIFLPK